MILRLSPVDEVLRRAGCAPEDLLAEPDRSAVVPTSPGAVPFSEGALGTFDRAAARWPSVTLGRLLVTLVDDLSVRPGRWEVAAPALELLSDPPATAKVTAHQLRLDSE